MIHPDRDVYVISDLHIGGRYPESTAIKSAATNVAGAQGAHGAQGASEMPMSPPNRGFRMCTRVDALTEFVLGLTKKARNGEAVELVINGDFVDFLAEEETYEPDEEGPTFVPFVHDPVRARSKLNSVVQRDAPFFSALASLVEAKGKLTILLGNHDVELSFPLVRSRLREVLGVSENSAFQLIYDGEAYVVGDALIEHGNRYDGFNVVDHDSLRRVRSFQSRNWRVPPEYEFSAPPGSHLVAEIMNPIKKDYPFVDLLKPEIETVIPILLALEPKYKWAAKTVLELKKEANRHAPVEPGVPAYGGDASASEGAVSAGDTPLANGPTEPSTTTLLQTLRSTLPGQSAEAFLAGISDTEMAIEMAKASPLSEPQPQHDAPNEDVASYGISEAWGLLKLAVMKESSGLRKRLPALLAALRVAQNDKSFDRSVETEKSYLEAAEALAANGFRYIVFGHTHLAKQFVLNRRETPENAKGAVYLNTGTWADLIQFPPSILDPKNTNALNDLETFVDDIAQRRFSKWIRFQPTFAKLEVRGGKVATANIVDFVV